MFDKKTHHKGRFLLHNNTFRNSIRILVICAVILLGYDEISARMQRRRWRVSHNYEDCDSLPEYDPSKTYLHQSYKTSNESEWNSVYKFAHKEWFDLHPDWEPIFWTDEQNELLFFCHEEKDHFAKFLQMAHKIKRVDYSKIMYLYVYGGMYADFDYIPLENQDNFFKKYPDIDLFLQQEQTGEVAFEWAFSRKPNHTYIRFLMHNITSTYSVHLSTGRYKLSHAFRDYFHSEFETMKDVGDRTMLVDRKYISPVSHAPWKKPGSLWSCVTVFWSGTPLGKRGNGWSKEAFENTTCYSDLKEKGYIAVTVYTSSWGGRDHTAGNKGWDGKPVSAVFYTKGRERKSD